MLGAIGSQAVSLRGVEPGDQGRRAEAVGQQAKAAVAAARDAGLGISRNAQGMAASAVARGMDPASLFAARVAEAGPDADSPDAIGAEAVEIDGEASVEQTGDAAGKGLDPGADVAIPATSALGLLIDGEQTERAV